MLPLGSQRSGSSYQVVISCVLMAQCLKRSVGAVRLTLRYTRELSLRVGTAENCLERAFSSPQIPQRLRQLIPLSISLPKSHPTTSSGPCPRTQLLGLGPQPNTQPSPMMPLPNPYIHIGLGYLSPLLFASWLPCCSRQIPGASHWPGGFPTATPNCSRRRGSWGQNSMLNVILHTASESTKADDNGPGGGSGQTPCVCRSSSPKIVPGCLGSRGASPN